MRLFLGRNPSDHEQPNPQLALQKLKNKRSLYIKGNLNLASRTWELLLKKIDKIRVQRITVNDSLRDETFLCFDMNILEINGITKKNELNVQNFPKQSESQDYGRMLAFSQTSNPWSEMRTTHTESRNGNQFIKCSI